MGRRRRRQTAGPPKCRTCDRTVVWFKSPFKPGWRTFEPKAVDGITHTGTPAYPVDGGVQAWRLTDLVVELMGRWSIGQGEAEEHAYAMPWYVLHACLTDEPPVADHDAASPAYDVPRSNS